MPLGARELLVIIRARDVASRVVRDVGTSFGALAGQGKLTAAQLTNIGAAMTGVGVAMAGVGLAGLAFFNDATDAAIEYNREAALTKTQVQEVGVSVKDLADIGRRTAAEIPAPFEQMQAALYDIFSSMDINVMQAEMLLRRFSMGAVAGQTDIQTAARSTISILNAYQLPVSEVNRIMDLQFQLVRKGVGTYEEFNSAIGRAIPAAVAAGQSFETLAGMMAFLTRNGLSTEMAATSAARAMELFADPKRFHKLEALGVTVRDANGDFLQMNDIITQLANNQAWATMSEPERKELFQDIFGQGTIQARRFFDTAIPNYQQLNNLTGDMLNSAGALEGAYDTMFNEPASQAQLLQNQYEILKTEIGDELIPMKLRLMETVMRLLDWWNNLGEGTQDLIIKVVLFTSAALVVAGVVLTVIGAFAMLVGVLAPVVGGIGAASSVIGAIIVGITLAIASVYAWATGNKVLIAILSFLTLGVTLLIGAIMWLIKNFETVKATAIDVWNTIKEWSSVAWQSMQDFWDWLSAAGVDIWHDIHSAVVDFWGVVQDLANFLWQNLQGIWDTITESAVSAWRSVLDAGRKLWSWLKGAYNWLENEFGPGFHKVWDSLVGGIGGIIKEVIETLDTFWGNFTTGARELGKVLGWLFGLVVDFVEPAIGVMLTKFMPVWILAVAAVTNAWAVIEPILLFMWETFDFVFNIIWQIVQFAMDVIVNTITLAVGFLVSLWQNFGSILWSAFKIAWDLVTSILAAALTIISNLIQFVLNLIQGDWGEAWDNIKNIFKAAWDAIWAALLAVGRLLRLWFVDLPGNIISWIGDVGNLLWDKGFAIIASLWNGMKSIWQAARDWLGSFARNIKAFFEGAVNWLWNAGRAIIEGLWDGMRSMWQNVRDWAGSLGGAIVDLKGPPREDAKLLVENGRLIMQGLQVGLEQGWSDVVAFLGSASNEMSMAFGSPNLLPGTFVTGGVSGANGVLGVPATNTTQPQAGIYVENLNVREEHTVSDLDWWFTTLGTGI